MDEVENLKYINCQANINRRYGFYFWQGSDCKPIYHVTISDCKASGNTYSALRFQGSDVGRIEYIDVEYNKFRNKGSSADIWLNEYCDHFKIVYNEGTLSYPTAGKDYEVHDNHG